MVVRMAVTMSVGTVGIGHGTLTARRPPLKQEPKRYIITYHAQNGPQWAFSLVSGQLPDQRQAGRQSRQRQHHRAEHIGHREAEFASLVEQRGVQ